MKWQQGRRSDNVEDTRDSPTPGRGRLVRGAGLGGGAILLVVAIALVTGQDPLKLLQQVEQQAPTSSTDAQPDAPLDAPPDAPAGYDAEKDFISVILADTEDTWTALFAKSGRTYEPPKLRLFSDAVDSACGYNSAAVGPFYCPADRRVYLDLAFFRELDEQFGAPGDFAQAYVVAHEVGHHVQKLLGISDQAHGLSRGSSEAEANDVSVRTELQADCFAGVWAHHAQAQRQLLEGGDLEEGLRAAAAIGDDRLQRMGTGRVQPEAWTHGSSEMRVRWFRRGFDSGDPDQCDTFSVETP
jgi:predicted metalloprotease